MKRLNDLDRIVGKQSVVVQLRKVKFDSKCGTVLQGEVPAKGKIVGKIGIAPPAVCGIA